MPLSMTLAPHRRSAAAELLRVVAVWLAVTVLLQGFAAARALGLGPLHRHHEQLAPGHAVLAHRHQHDGAERHHHDRVAHDVSPVDWLEQGLDDAAFALTAALALMVSGSVAVARMAAPRLVWCPAESWAFCSRTPDRPLKPPRLA